MERPGIFHRKEVPFAPSTPNPLPRKDRGTEPKRDKSQFPWFRDGDTFTGERANDIHLAIAQKQAAGDAKVVE